MWLFVKRAFLLIMLLIVTGIGYLIALENSENFAVDMAFLECTRSEIGGNSDQRVLDAVEKAQRKIIYGKLQKDHLQNRVLLTWVADQGESESGLSTSHSLRISVSNYSGFDYLSSVRRTIDRESLIYRLTKEVSSIDKTIEYHVERQCQIIDREIFESNRLKSANATKAKQKI